MKKSEYQVITSDDSGEEEPLIVQSACHILTYVCEVLNAIKPANIDNSSQFLSAIDSVVPKDFNRLFQKNIFADFNKDFESLVEFIKKNESKATEQNLTKIEKKKSTKRRNNRFGTRRGSKTLDKGKFCNSSLLEIIKLNLIDLGAKRTDNIDKNELSLFDYPYEDEEMLEYQDITGDSNYETNDNLDLEDFTDDDEDEEQENETNADIDNGNFNEDDDSKFKKN